MKGINHQEELSAKTLSRRMSLELPHDEHAVQGMCVFEMSVSKSEMCHLSGFDIRARVDESKFDERVVKATKLYEKSNC